MPDRTPARADLANLFKPQAQPEPFRQGEILTFDAATGANTVAVGGAVLTDLPLLNQGDTVNLRGRVGDTPGDAVILLKYRSAWAILGRIIRPGGEALSTVAVDFFAQGDSVGGPFDLTTGFVTRGTRTITTPPWANSMLVMATSTVVATNTTASSDYIRLITDINGGGGGETIIQVEPGKQTTAIAPVARELGGDSGYALNPTTQIDVRVKSYANTWPNGGGAAFLNVMALFRKV